MTVEQHPSGRRVQAGEGRAVAISFVYFFCVLAAYYVIRPVREQLSAAVGSTQLPWFYAATFLTTLGKREDNPESKDRVVGQLDNFRYNQGLF